MSRGLLSRYVKFKSIRDVQYIVIHCSATDPSQDIGVEEIKQWHVRRKFLDIGYHYVIRRDGTLEEGRDVRVQGAHARGFNHISLGICMAGGISDARLPDDNFTEAQWECLESLVGYLKGHHPDAQVLGHRDLPKVTKACPSFDAIKWWASVEEKQYDAERIDHEAPSEGKDSDET